MLFGMVDLSERLKKHNPNRIMRRTNKTNQTLKQRDQTKGTHPGVYRSPRPSWPCSGVTHITRHTFRNLTLHESVSFSVLLLLALLMFKRTSLVQRMSPFEWTSSSWPGLLVLDLLTYPWENPHETFDPVVCGQ